MKILVIAVTILLNISFVQAASRTCSSYCAGTTMVHMSPHECHRQGRDTCIPGCRGVGRTENHHLCKEKVINKIFVLEELLENSNDKQETFIKTLEDTSSLIHNLQRDGCGPGMCYQGHLAGGCQPC